MVFEMVPVGIKLALFAQLAIKKCEIYVHGCH